MAFVTLDGGSNVTGLFANPQPQLPGYAVVADSDPRIATFQQALAAAVAPKPTPRQWIERLAPATQQAIATAATTNAAILLWLLKASGSDYIDVAAPETQQGVMALVNAQVITLADQTTLLTP